MNGNGGNGFYGRYRGRVNDNVDPLRRGRLLVEVPDVLGRDPCIWAESANPLAGEGMGLFVLPQVDDGVWVEFEHGDPERAVWTGSWRGSQAEIPAPAQAAPQGAAPPIVLQTPDKNTIVLSDAPGPAGKNAGILIKCDKSGAFIAVDEKGITIDNGRGTKITLQGTTIDIKGARVNIN
jgi:uncharacterized protein involved in type VI secretion and phage assembly